MRQANTFRPGRTTTYDGRPMSINVEEVGGSLAIQHYVAEIHEPRHCQLVSLTGVHMPGGWTKAHVTWDMRVEPIDESTSRLVNSVNIHPTQGFLDLLAQGGVSFEDAAAQQHAAVSAHNERETALFAISIARKAQTNLPTERAATLRHRYAGANSGCFVMGHGFSISRAAYQLFRTVLCPLGEREAVHVSQCIGGDPRRRYREAAVVS